METVPETVLSLLRTGRRFVLTTHVNPDGDGIGSELALGLWLREQQKDVAILNASSTPLVYRFLDPGGMIQQYNPSRDRAIVAEADSIIVLDTNQADRLVTMQDAVMEAQGSKLCIDHHLEPHPFADHYLLDPDATSSGEIVYRILDAMDGGCITPPIATALYCAIMTDTGSFRYPRVDAETHRIAARLLECGADPVAIYTRVYEQWTEGRIRLLGGMLSNLGIAGDGRIAHVTVTRDLLHQTGTEEEDTDNFTTYPMSVGNVVIGILFVELPDGVKMSFRSKGSIPINELAKEFGGNGHRNAAGASLRDVTLATIKGRVLAAAELFLSQHGHD